MLTIISPHSVPILHSPWLPCPPSNTMQTARTALVSVLLPSLALLSTPISQLPTLPRLLLLVLLLTLLLRLAVLLRPPLLASLLVLWVSWLVSLPCKMGHEEARMIFWPRSKDCEHHAVRARSLVCFFNRIIMIPNFAQLILYGSCLSSCLSRDYHHVRAPVQRWRLAHISIPSAATLEDGN
jgi:hypothetical protein